MTYTDSNFATKPAQDYFRVIEDAATAAAYQLVKRSLDEKERKREESMRVWQKLYLCPPLNLGYRGLP